MNLLPVFDIGTPWLLGGTRRVELTTKGVFGRRRVWSVPDPRFSLLRVLSRVCLSLV